MDEDSSRGDTPHRPQPEERSNCPNCGIPLVGQFCHGCGQKGSGIQVSVWKLVGEVLGEAIEADGRLPRTLLPFFFRPGFLISEYVAGRRKLYTSPLRLYIFSALISFFLVGFIGIGGLAPEQDTPTVVVLDADEADQIGTAPGQGTLIRPEGQPDNWFEEQLFASVDKIEALGPERASEVLIAVYLDLLAKAVSLLLPVFALLLKIFYRRRFYSEHFVFSLNVHALGLILISLGTLTSSAWGIWGAVALTSTHVLLALKRVYGDSWIRTVLKFSLLSLVYGLIMTFTFGTATVVAFLAM